MARPGVSYQDIVVSIEELKGQGKNITIENIRTLLGTGSIGTINKYLRQWREIQASTGKLASKENLPEELVSLMKGLWEGVLTQSLQRFEPLEANYQQEISELKTDLEKYKNNNQRWQKLFNQWQQEKTALANEKLTLEQALEFAHKENHSVQTKQDGLLQQLLEKQERIDELHRLHQQTQANLEHYRESAREQRLLDRQEFEREKQQLQLETKNLKEHLLMKTHQMGELEQHIKSTQLNLDSLEKEHDKVQQILETTNKELTESKQLTQEYLLSTKHLKTELQETKELFSKLQNNLLDHQSENKLLSHQILEFKKTIDAMDAQNKLLANEKWILTQEKSQLEGQLKQLQQSL